MTDQQKAIAALITAIESGEFDALPESARSPYFNRFMDIAEYALPQNVTGCNALAWRAYHQHSLDAARALHDAVLPGWGMQINIYEDDSFEASVSQPLQVKTYDGVSPFMARAWLLAILRALKSQVNHD